MHNVKVTFSGDHDILSVPKSELHWISLLIIGTKNSNHQLKSHCRHPNNWHIVFQMSSIETIVIFLRMRVHHSAQVTYTTFTRSKNYVDRDLDGNLDCDLDRNPVDVPVYMVHSLFNTTKHIKLLFIVQSLLHQIVVHCSVIVTLQST